VALRLNLNQGGCSLVLAEREVEELRRMFPPLEELPELPLPANFMDFNRQECYEFRVLRWFRAKLVIRPTYPGAPKEKLVRVLRVFVPEEFQPVGPGFWDIAQGTLQAQLLPILMRPGFEAYVFRVCRVGVPPARRFRVEVRRVV